MIRSLLMTGILAVVSFMMRSPAVEAEPAPYNDLLQYVVASVVPEVDRPEDPYFVWTEEDAVCMALNIFYEAGIEEFQGKLAVGTVTLNRLATGRWGSTICSVVWSRKQFSWTNNVSPNAPLPEGILWQESIEAAAEVLSGNVVPDLNGSLHYHADYVQPYWSRSKSEVATIGTHIFYHN